MAELRLDPFTRRWVVTGKRPIMPDVHDQGGACPFCPGNEHMTPQAIREYPRLRPGRGWPGFFTIALRYFEWKAALTAAPRACSTVMNTVGAHEIVVETPVMA